MAARSPYTDHSTLPTWTPCDSICVCVLPTTFSSTRRRRHEARLTARLTSTSSEPSTVGLTPCVCEVVWTCSALRTSRTSCATRRSLRTTASKDLSRSSTSADPSRPPCSVRPSTDSTWTSPSASTKEHTCSVHLTPTSLTTLTSSVAATYACSTTLPTG